MKIQMKKTVIFINSTHFSLDDRTFYHHAKSLNEDGYHVIIICAKEELNCNIDGISIHSFDDKSFNQNEKIQKIVSELIKYQPDLIICDSPISVYASNIYKKKLKIKIIYDITEWYPSKKNLKHFRGIKKIFRFLLLSAANLNAGWKADSFIFGEYYKSLPFRYIVCWKQSLYLSYYPDLKYIKQYPAHTPDKEINFLYSGIINPDKGIDNIINVLKSLSQQKPEIQINLKIIGYFPSSQESNHFNSIISELKDNVHIELLAYMPFIEYCQVIGDTHFFFDLRSDDCENTHCMPIKLFYYLACGRPIIYSNLRSIKHEIRNTDYGFLSNPMDYRYITSRILDYISKPEKYIQHANNALTESTEKYNWSEIESDFRTFISNNI
jgi:glycosyltransferase involved in cell wall biosynthesis